MSTQFIDFMAMDDVFLQVNPCWLDMYDALSDAGIEPHGADLTSAQLRSFADYAYTADHYGHEWSMSAALEFARTSAPTH